MQKKWFTYGFLSLMITALITLAILQYSWLGSVSAAEKQRLEESLSAASDNFVAEFNRSFAELGQAFRLQIPDVNVEIEPLLVNSYTNWIRAKDLGGLVEGVYFIEYQENDEPIFYELDQTSLVLTSSKPNKEVSLWINKNYDSDDPQTVTPLRTHPDFGDPTFLPIPVQVLNMITMNKESFGQKIQVQLSVDQISDVVLLKLNDEFIKSEFIPRIARTFFSDSYMDQYQLSIVSPKKDEESLYVYFSSEKNEPTLDPDFTTQIDRINFNSIFLQSDEDLSFRTISARKKASAFGFTMNSEGLEDISRFDSSLIINGTKSIAHVFSERQTEQTLGDSENLKTVVRTDTTMTASFIGSIPSSTWELWLSFKEGSLDAFVNKTRNRNLAISFGILGILGVSVILIVVFSQRSKELADQQMLFVAGVSHELRTPLTVIRSAAENLTEGVIQSEERKKEYAELMLKEGRRLSDMVDQIMEFSGIQSGKRVYHFNKVNITDLLESVKEECGYGLETHDMKLDYFISTKREEIQADQDALFLSITNLINNAIKFSGESKKIVLKLDEVSFKGNLGLRIQVQDFGIGIPEREQREIFKPFFRGDKSVSDQVKGNGIGLSLVKKVVEAHNGEVTVKSKIGEGSTFSIIIPLEEFNG